MPFEPGPLEEPLVIYRDDEIIVVDKPHGMPVTASGEYVERSLLVHLQKSTGLVSLAPRTDSTGRPRDFSYSSLSVNTVRITTGFSRMR